MARERDIKAILARLLAEMDDEDALSELDELKAKLDAGFTVTPAMIRQAIDEAEPQERAAMREWLRELVKDDDAPPPPDPPTDPPADPPADPPPGDPPPAVPTRPGRKSGSAYAWDVDEDGRVIDLDVARIYNGPTEDERVVLPPDEDPPTDE